MSIVETSSAGLLAVSITGSVLLVACQSIYHITSRILNLGNGKMLTEFLILIDIFQLAHGECSLVRCSLPPLERQHHYRCDTTGNVNNPALDYFRKDKTRFLLIIGVVY